MGGLPTVAPGGGLANGLLGDAGLAMRVLKIARLVPDPPLFGDRVFLWLNVSVRISELVMRIGS